MVSAKSLGTGEVQPLAIQRLWQLVKITCQPQQANPFGWKADKEYMENCHHNQL